MITANRSAGTHRVGPLPDDAERRQDDEDDQDDELESEAAETRPPLRIEVVALVLDRLAADRHEREGYAKRSRGVAGARWLGTRNRGRESRETHFRRQQAREPPRCNGSGGLPRSAARDLSPGGLAGDLRRGPPDSMRFSGARFVLGCSGGGPSSGKPVLEPEPLAGERQEPRPALVGRRDERERQLRECRRRARRPATPRPRSRAPSSAPRRSRSSPSRT